MMNRYVFMEGCWAPRRRVSVKAKNEDDAIGKVWAELDRRHERNGDEPPVGYTLELVETETCF